MIKRHAGVFCKCENTFVVQLLPKACHDSQFCSCVPYACNILFFLSELMAADSSRYVRKSFKSVS